MTKRLVAKVGEYEKNGEVKGEYVRIGVILSNQNGEYALLDPTINLAGVLQKQNRYKHSRGEQTGDSVMVSVFSDEPRQAQQDAPQAGNFDDALPF